MTAPKIRAPIRGRPARTTGGGGTLRATCEVASAPPWSRPIDHPLDRPIWSALATCQARLAIGDKLARRYHPDYALFAAAADRSPASLRALASLVPAADEIWVVEASAPPTPAGVKVSRRAVVNQMIAKGLSAGGPELAFEPLTELDAPEMLALATLTQPGPFFSRTHQLGEFVGIRQQGRLVAMAGERMKADGFSEVSGVCTHPDFRGRGYAGGLMRVVAARILERGETPFLHVYASNDGAIALYKDLGFKCRAALEVSVLTRD